ncbi:MAG TPA: hypothetical protein VMS92_14375 [Mycobacterium sp.]|nr:hypothetical protein [Mycobacterium sp.]
MNTNRNKLALRRQSIRTLTDSELRIAHGGGNGAITSLAPGTDRQTIGTSGTSVIHASSGTSVINPSGGSVANPSGGSVLNPSGGRVLNPSGG